ncbi:MAG: hypothetical protein WDW38_011268 [Sanguina aurantia]
MRKSVFIFTVAALLASASALAQVKGNVRYKWHDGQNLLHFSDSLTAETMKYGYDVVNDQGLIIQHVPRQLTADERIAANKVAAEETIKQRIEQDRLNGEAQMMEAYPDEASYRTFQQRALDTMDQQIHTTQLNMRTQEKALTDLLARAADLERTEKRVPPTIVDSIAAQRVVVTTQRTTLQRQQVTREQLVKDQVVQLARYRQIKASEGK